MTARGLAGFAHVKDGMVIGNEAVVQNDLTGLSELSQIAVLFDAGPEWLSFVPKL